MLTTEYTKISYTPVLVIPETFKLSVIVLRPATFTIIQISRRIMLLQEKRY